MSQKSVGARRRLDRRFERLRALAAEPRPHRGWVRAIRDALGMTGPELAARMEITQPAVAQLESSEANGTVGIESLRRAAAALNCDFVYFLIPRTSIEDMVDAQARRKAADHLTGVAHHGRLEDQEVDSVTAADEVAVLARRLKDRRGLWSDVPE
jgi:predicted DNA-binding mobile mystery protein A